MAGQARRSYSNLARPPKTVDVPPDALRLNLACGKDIRPRAEGWTNMDVVALPGVDVVQSATNLPWPFPDDRFGHVLVSHYLEHVPHDLHNGRHTDGFLQVLEEIHRVLRPGGTLEVFVPHWDSAWTWRDPTHTRAVHPDNFLYVSDDSQHGYYTTARFRLRLQEVTRRSAPWPGALRMGPSRLGVWEHVAVRAPWVLRPFRSALHPLEMHFVLECVK